MKSICELLRLRKPTRRLRRAGCGLDSLESRVLLATLVGTNKVTYQDADGDDVTVTFSKSILTAGNVNSIFTFSSGPGAVNGSNAVKEQLRLINLSAGAAGTTITTVATRNAVNKGDGFAAIGYVLASGIDLGAVTIDGDLGEIDAGDNTTSTPAVGGLTVQSLGRFGTSTGAFDNESNIRGSLASLKVKTDVRGRISVSAPTAADGKIGSVAIGGSMIGGVATGSGTLFSSGDMGALTIGGDLLGGIGNNSGSIITSGSLASATIGGSVIGGSGTFSGRISSTRDMGAVKVGGNVIGGTNSDSGEITSGQKLAGVTISGSLIGGVASFSGYIFSNSDMGPVKIAGNIQGGAAGRSGEIQSLGRLTSLTLGGSLIGGGQDANSSGAIEVTGELSTLTITGSIVGGSASGAGNLINTGFVSAGRIGTMSLGGSFIAGTDNTAGAFVNNGAILVTNDIASLSIKGSIIGNSTNAALVSTRGQLTPSASANLALGKLAVTGRVEYALIRVGHSAFATSTNADAQVGPVTVGGDWVASTLAAGADPGLDGLYGTADDIKYQFGTDTPGTVSKIVSISIGGQVIGTAGAGDHFGFVAENVGSLKIGGTTISLFAGNGNDDQLLTILFNDLRLSEI